MSHFRLHRLAAAVAIGFAAALTLSAVALAEQNETPKATLVKIHADWCGTCTMLNATWDALRKEHAGKVRFVILDVTNQKTLERSRAEAERLGLGDLFERYKASTGTVAIVDSASGRTVRVMKGELDASKYRPVIANLLDS